MNVYDFDKTIYNGDSTADFYLYSLKKHPKILLLVPSVIFAAVKYYAFKKGNKTQMKESIYKFLKYCNIQKDINEFWDKHIHKIKKWYIEQRKEDDVIISASPEFLLKPVCKKMNINFLIASNVNQNTGKYTGINCHGKEKVKRFYKVFPNGKIAEFYSDSYSDSPLADISQKSFLVKGNKINKWKHIC